MASFVGTKEEFKRYIGPMLRNLVQQLTRKHKMEVGCCEHCQTTENLEAAHVHGKDRGALIDKILNKYTTNSMVTIDLADFEQHFRNEHHEIDKTILILCKTCHTKYDSKGPAVKESSQTPEEQPNPINPHLPDTAIEQALAVVSKPESLDVVVSNRAHLLRVTPSQAGYQPRAD